MRDVANTALISPVDVVLMHISLLLSLYLYSYIILVFTPQSRIQNIRRHYFQIPRHFIPENKDTNVHMIALFQIYW